LKNKRAAMKFFCHKRRLQTLDKTYLGKKNKRRIAVITKPTVGQRKVSSWGEVVRTYVWTERRETLEATYPAEIEGWKRRETEKDKDVRLPKLP